MRAQSNVLDMVSVCAVAEKRSKTSAYLTESGETIKLDDQGSIFSTWRQHHKVVQSVAAAKLVSQGTGCSKRAAQHCA